MHSFAGRVGDLTWNDIPVGKFLITEASNACHEVCDVSDDHWHHADEHDYIKVSEGKDGTYAVRAKCKYCHKEFVASGLTADSLSDAYTDYVSTLPASGYDSAGTLLWQPRWSDAVAGTGYFGTSASSSFDITTGLSRKYSDFARCSASGSCLEFSFSYQSSKSYYCDITYVAFECPISGYYSQLDTVHWSCSIIQAPNLNLGETEDSTYTKSVNWPVRSSNTGSHSAGARVTLYCPESVGHRIALKGGVVDVYTPVFSIVPADQPVITNNYYINTRVNNFNGDYYDSVTNNYYNNTTIVNETTNNYYDMTTNTTYVMQKWSYDYQSRTYFITLEDGTTVTVQFGDDCMTITNNNVTNSYQYVIKNTPSTPDTPTTCKHEWTETIDTAPTCLEGGHASYTCSKCGETYEQILAAKGHDWKVIEHVNMVYNSDGTVATQGHTLYQCSVCGEQWYTDTGAPPPDVSGSSSILAWLQSFQTWLEEKLDLTPVLERLDAILAQLQDTSGSATCDHTYQQHMEQEADCTLPGLQISTCSQCGDSYSEIIDPLGHDWVVTSHVDAVTDPDTGEETASAYDVYTCSRCGKTYEDHTGDGAPDEDYGDTSISQLVVKVFSKLGTFAGKLIGFIVRLFDKAISSVDEVISKFNEYTEQISGFGGDYPAWLTGFWTVLPSELQVALTFAVVCMVLGIVGKKLFFS